VNDSTPGLIGPINWGSNVVNGQLVPQAPTSAFFPTYMGAQYVNPKWPSAFPYGVPPVVPSTTIGGISSPMSAPAPTQAGATNKSGLFHPTRGTIFFGLGALIIGLFMLHYIHYGGSKK